MTKHSCLFLWDRQFGSNNAIPDLIDKHATVSGRASRLGGITAGRNRERAGEHCFHRAGTRESILRTTVTGPDRDPVRGGRDIWNLANAGTDGQIEAITEPRSQDNITRLVSR